jgi:hypothetical protein
MISASSLLVATLAMHTGVQPKGSPPFRLSSPRLHYQRGALWAHAMRERPSSGQLGGRVPQSRDTKGDKLGKLRIPSQLDDAEDAYSSALFESQLASARLRQAESKLSAARRRGTPRAWKARLRKATISRTDAGTLLVDIPGAGVSSSTLFGGAFTAAWFSAIVPATASMLASGGVSALFMLPFWVAGGTVAKQTILDPARSTSLSIGEYAWELCQTLPGGITVSSDGGPTEELQGAEAAVSAYVNGVPTYALQLVAGSSMWTAGEGLSLDELEAIADEVNVHIDALQSS